MCVTSMPIGTCTCMYTCTKGNRLSTACVTGLSIDKVHCMYVLGEIG